MNYKIYSILIFLFIFASCSSDSFELTDESTVDGAAPYEEGAIPHPQPNMMPHADVEAVDLVLHEGSDILSDLPENLQLLHRYLNDENDQFDQRELSLYVSNEYHFHAASKDENTLVMLDERDDKLYQYDLLKDEYTDLAPKGRGPGDIMFTKEMQFYDNRAYIAMQGFRISVFDCQSDLCEYENTIETEFNTYSLAPEKDRLTILGLPPFGRDQDPDPENIDQHIIHQLNGNGKVENSFSPVYQHNNPILRESMNSNGMVRTFPNHETQVVAYSSFPHLYMYNYQGELIDKYKIPGFKQGYYDHKEEADGNFEGRYRYNDNSRIVHASKINEEWMLLTIREHRNLEWVDRILTGEEWYSYYAFNVDDNQFYKIGEDEKQDVGENKTVFPTDHGLVINGQGTLFWINSR